MNIWQDDDEWTASVFLRLEQSSSDSPQSWEKIADPILHIELRRWADLVLIAPCSANTLAKLAGGLCDNLATSLLRALPPMSPRQTEPPPPDSLAGANKGVQVWVFPAMNTLMYEHPLTAAHLKIVTDTLKYRVEGPIGESKSTFIWQVFDSRRQRTRLRRHRPRRNDRMAGHCQDGSRRISFTSYT